MNRESIQIRSSRLMCQLCDAAGEFPSEFLYYADCRLAPSVQVCGSDLLVNVGTFQNVIFYTTDPSFGKRLRVGDSFTKHSPHASNSIYEEVCRLMSREFKKIIHYGPRAHIPLSAFMFLSFFAYGKKHPASPLRPPALQNWSSLCLILTIFELTSQYEGQTIGRLFISYQVS